MFLSSFYSHIFPAVPKAPLTCTKINIWLWTDIFLLKEKSKYLLRNSYVRTSAHQVVEWDIAVWDKNPLMFSLSISIPFLFYIRW